MYLHVPKSQDQKADNFIENLFICNNSTNYSKKPLETLDNPDLTDNKTENFDLKEFDSPDFSISKNDPKIINLKDRTIGHLKLERYKRELRFLKLSFEGVINGLNKTMKSAGQTMKGGSRSKKYDEPRQNQSAYSSKQLEVEARILKYRMIVMKIEGTLDNLMK